MKRTIRRKMAAAKKRIGRRLERAVKVNEQGPVLAASNIHYQLADRAKAISHLVTERMTFGAHVHHAAKLESIGTLAGGVAHDINNTLSVVMAYASLFHDELEGEYRNDAMEMLKACRRGRDMMCLSTAHRTTYDPGNRREFLPGLSRIAHSTGGSFG